MDWTYIITEVVKWLVGLAVSAAGVAATAWLKSRREIDVNKETDEARRALLWDAERAIGTAVGYVNQTITSKIKGTEAWTDEAKEEAKERAVSVFESIMGENGMTLLYTALDNVKEWVNANIEAAVLERGEVKSKEKVSVGEETMPADGGIGKTITEIIEGQERERTEESYVPVENETEAEPPDGNSEGDETTEIW